MSRLLLALAAFIAATAFAAQPPATVEQPRPFGYVVGDLVTQRVLLTAKPDELPAAQRVNIWFERRAPSIEKTADGRDWLVVTYQVINAPPALTTLLLPPWKLKVANVQMEIPAAPISIAPLVSNTSNAAGELRPDREVSSIDTAGARAGALLWSIALAVTLAAWLGWWQWRNWWDGHEHPFARALHELRHLDDTAPEAWQAMHRAFDRTAGRVLQIETLSALFERAPQLLPRRADIERFFTQSNQRFFGAGSQGELLSVSALCQELRRIERRHAP